MSYIYIGKSKIHEEGVFTKKAIKPQTKICVLTGKQLASAALLRYLTDNPEEGLNILQIDHWKYLALSKVHKKINHSCNPNCCIKKTNELWSIKPIEQHTELCYDYSLTAWENPETCKDAGYSPFLMEPCNCGAKNCRKKIACFYELPFKQQEFSIKNGQVQDFIIQNYFTKYNVK